MPRQLKLNCIVLDGSNTNQIFSVRISDEDSNVDDLKEKIKEKKRAAFDHIPADTLKLWNVSISPKKFSEARLRELTPPLESLDSLEELSWLFPDTPQKDHLHIIVQPPRVQPPCTAGVS